MASRRPAVVRALAIAALVASGLALVGLIAAPFAMPADYSILADTVSKAGGQGIPQGWITKLAFALTGLAALAIAGASWPVGGRLAAAAHVAFAACMLAATFFETRSWRAEAAYDQFEHDRHSDASNAAAAAFVVCVFLTLRANAPNPRWRNRLGIATIVASAATPVLMTIFRNADGAMERAWFLLAFAWWASTAWRLARGPD